MILSTKLIFLLLAVAGGVTADLKNIAIAIRKGDHNAFREFFSEQYPVLYRFLKSRGISHDDAEDLIQKAFVLIWEKRDHIDENKSLRAYLFQIAYTRMLNHIKYQSRFQEDPTDYLDGSTDDISSEMDHSELQEKIQLIIRNMPEKRAMIFDMCFNQQFTYKEVAESLGLSQKTVENHMSLAFKDLRSSLCELYPDLEYVT